MLYGRSFFFMFMLQFLAYDFVQRYCALDAAINDEIRRRCHLIVNSLEKPFTISSR
jgi:hypothetical protein